MIDQTQGADASTSLVSAPASSAATISAPIQAVPAEGRAPWRRTGTLSALVDRALDGLDAIGDTVAGAIGLR